MASNSVNFRTAYAVYRRTLWGGSNTYAPTAYYLTEHSESNLQMVGKVFASQSVGIAVQKGDQQLLDKLNQGLETLYKNGTYDRIYEQWFGPKIEVIGVA